jgi:hypothetical protein
MGRGDTIVSTDNPVAIHFHVRLLLCQTVDKRHVAQENAFRET